MRTHEENLKFIKSVKDECPAGTTVVIDCDIEDCPAIGIKDDCIVVYDYWCEDEIDVIEFNDVERIAKVATYIEDYLKIYG